MVTRQTVTRQIESHLEGFMSLEDLAAWAEETFRTEEFEPDHAHQIVDILAAIREAVDPHRFRWEEPDFAEMLERLQE